MKNAPTSCSFANRRRALVLGKEQIVNVGGLYSAPDYRRCAKGHERIEHYRPAAPKWIPPTCQALWRREVDLLGELPNDRRDHPLPTRQEFEDRFSSFLNFEVDVRAVGKERLPCEVARAENLVGFVQSPANFLKGDPLVQETLHEQQVHEVQERGVRGVPGSWAADDRTLVTNTIAIAVPISL